MGLSFRGRTKGSSWINYSASGKGLSGSVSTKISKNITVNFKPGRGFRTTVNLGHGVKWVSSTAKAPKPKVVRERKQTAAERRRDEAEDAAWAIELAEWIEELKARVRVARKDIAETSKYRDEVKHNIESLYVQLNALSEEPITLAVIQKSSEIDESIFNYEGEHVKACESIIDKFKAIYTTVVNPVWHSDVFDESDHDHMKLVQKLSIKPAEYTNEELRESFNIHVMHIRDCDNLIDWRLANGWVESDLFYYRLIRNKSVEAIKKQVSEYAETDERLRELLLPPESPTKFILATVGVVLLCIASAYSIMTFNDKPMDVAMLDVKPAIIVEQSVIASEIIAESSIEPVLPDLLAAEIDAASSVQNESVASEMGFIVANDNP